MGRYFDKKMMLASVLGVSLVGLVVPTAMARMGENQPCANCHTMHNSQDGGTMAFDIDGVATEIPNQALLIKAGCVACHTGTNTGSNGIPYVFDTAKAKDLAGGNFAWVNDDEAHGHNVAEINVADLILGNTPPGGAGALPGGVSALTAQLRCAGTNGCHGDTTEPTQFGAVSGGHHGKAKTLTYTGEMDGSDLANSYRMLLGVKGIEDSLWEMNATASVHNQYYGIDRDTEDAADSTTGTISGLCAKCHSTFHKDPAGVDGTFTENMGSPWIRHPTDYDMWNVKDKEYGSYGGTGNPYLPGVPLASNLTNGVLSTVLQSSGDAIVTCVSCHRVHGSQFTDMLRWDYDADTTAMLAHAGDNSTGCFACHTTKDDV